MWGQTAAAAEAIIEVVVDSVDPLYGLSCLRTSLDGFLRRNPVLGDASSKSYALGLKSLGRSFERLPSEVLEEELPKAKDPIIQVHSFPLLFLRMSKVLTSCYAWVVVLSQALNDQRHPDLRLAAVNCLVAAQRVLGDETQLFTILGGLSTAQLSLLTYYFSKAGASTHVGGSGARALSNGHGATSNGFSSV